MHEVVDIYIADNIKDLECIVRRDQSAKAGKPQILENAIKYLYNTIIQENSDQEKCFILCHRYLCVIERLCKISDEKFIKIKYANEISRIKSKLEELRTILEVRYEEEGLRKKQEKQKILLPKVPTPKATVEKPLFPSEFISVRELYKAIQDNINLLIVDIRPENEYVQSKIKFENIINIPEDIIAPGLSANVLGQKLKDDIQKIWDKRDSFVVLVFLDWNSGSENVTCTKLNHLRDSIVEWDCRRQYKQHPVVLNGGFRDFFETYPGSVTNVHINFIRNNEDIDELLELESISYPEPNVSVMHLKQFTIEDLEESVKIEKAEEETQEKDENSNENIPVEDAKENKENMSPKGGGAVIDIISVEPEKDDADEEIKSKIEEERLKLLSEARNKKNKPGVTNTYQNLPENLVGDSSEIQIRYKVPPSVRRDTKPKKPVITGGWCGLVNIKNTCYMNSVLQCLKCIPVIKNILHSNFLRYITRQPPKIINEFATVIRALCEGSENDKKVYRPTAFYDIVCKLDPVYKKGNHEDCMEFFLFLFNHLNDDCASDLKKKSVMIEREKAWYAHLQGRTSLWVDLFYHQFQCTKICQVCHLEADSYETDNTLMLPVPYRPSLRMVHLKELIHEYMEDNQILDYKCSRCQHMRVVNRKSVVVEPEILVIVLKRYYQDEYQETRKNNVCVDFEHTFRFGNCNYKLYSVAQHRGTMDHGHYYAHGILNDSVWVEFNDERTTAFESDWDSIRGSACVFFYCKEKKTQKL